MPKRVLTDVDLIRLYVVDKKTMLCISNETKQEYKNLCQRIHDLNDRGLISAESVSEHNKTVFRKKRPRESKLVIDVEEFKHFYIAEGYGLRRLAKHYDCSISGIRLFIISQGLLQVGREYKKTREQKSKRIRSNLNVEFSMKTRKQAFERENGICQECHLPIEGNWRNVTYHHKRLVRNGGDSSLDNCAPLHHDCHWLPENFKKLHGFYPDRFMQAVN